MRRMRLAAVLLTALLLAGCSEIPTTGPVKPGSTEEPNGTSIVYLPNPPSAGASQREIVSGFLTAASAGGRFTVAKQYLTSAFAKTWKPRSRVLVQEAQPTITTVGPGDLAVQVPITARVSSDGVYKPDSNPVPLDFRLRQVAGQWRIDSAPDGIVLPQTVFQRKYIPQALDFFDQTWSRLVPDLRWFPVPSSGAALPSATSIVDALVSGPVGAIAGGVTANALADATVQAVDAGSSDVTTVALTVPKRNPGDEATDRMQQQLLQSLRLPSPSALRLVVNGSVAPQVKTLLNHAPSQSAYVVAGDRFGTLLSTGSFTPNDGLGKRIAALHPEAVTVSIGQGLAAVLSASHRVEIVSAAASKVVDDRSGLIAPTIDQRNWVYSIPRDSPNEMRASNAKGDSIDLVTNIVTNLPGASVKAIEASPDGTRMLVLLQATSGPVAFVAGIERNAGGIPTGLSTAHYPVDLGGSAGVGLSATWVDESDVAVLVSSPDDRVRLQQLGGFASSLGEIPNATSIVGTSSQSDLRVRLQTGDIWVQRKGIWEEQSAAAPNVSVLAVQR